jgi:hypothetical protein
LSTLQSVPGPAYGFEVIDQKQEEYVYNGSAVSITLYTGEVFGQVIKPALSPYVGIEVLIGPTLTSHTLTLRLREYTSGPDLGTILTEVTVNDVANGWWAGHWVYFDFSSPVALNIGSDYWIQVENTDTDTDVSWLGSQRDPPDSPYMGSQNPYWMLVTNHGTGNLQASYNQDFAFRTYAEVSDPSFVVEYNGTPVSGIIVDVCSSFTLDLLIDLPDDLPQGQGMVGFDARFSWDQSQVEIVEFIELGEEESRPCDQYTLPSNIAQMNEWGYVILYTTANPPWTEDSVWARITFHCLGEGYSSITVDSPPDQDTIYIGDGQSTPTPVDPVPYVVTCNQLSRAPSNPYHYVGGELFAANKLAVLSPYLALLSVVAVAAIVVKRKLT